MAETRVAVFGAGSLRCGPAAIASLAAWDPDAHVDLLLVESNRERLHLAELFAEACCQYTQNRYAVYGLRELESVPEGIDTAVICIGETCARGFRGTHAKATSIAAPDSHTQVRGDPNRPTLPEELMPSTLAALDRPVPTDATADEAVSWAVSKCLETLPAHARVASLLFRNVPDDPRIEARWAWPLPLTEQQRQFVPHQMLRWIHGDLSLGPFVAQSRESLLGRWLRGVH